MADVTVVFADLTGSTGIYESLGNAKATRAITGLTEWIGKVCASHEGRVVKYLGDGVDKVRREENRRLMRTGDITLKGTKYKWLRNPTHMTRAQKNEFGVLRDSHLKTARAWAMKEMAMDIWRYQRRGWAEKAWQEWLGWAQRCRLEPMKKVARTIKTHLWGIMNAIVLGVHNGHAESANSRIQRIKSRACGFRNRERFRNAIYFHCGGLDLLPEGVEGKWLPT